MKITVETKVRAPSELVWQAYTTPEDIVQWNAASEDWHTTKASVDLRVGGEFSSRMEAKDGSVGFDFAGTYTKVIPRNCWNTPVGTGPHRLNSSTYRTASKSASPLMRKRPIPLNSSKVDGRQFSIISPAMWKADTK
jgi:uncharacterized protein YndB with AHSA1/START domain